MIKQTITWTALPHGSNGPKQSGTELRLSVFVAPRLWNDDATVSSMPLSDFPDWLDWPALIAQASWEVRFGGGPNLAATPENVDLRSDMWQALFKPTTTVRPFVFEDSSGRTILTFPAATVHDSIKGIYQKAGTDPTWGGGTDLPHRDVVAEDPDIVDIARPVDPLPPWEPGETDRGPVFVGEEEEPPDDTDVGDGDEEEPEEPSGPLQGCSQGCFGCLFLPFKLIARLLEKLGIQVPVAPMAAEPLPDAGAPDEDAEAAEPEAAEPATPDSDSRSTPHPQPAEIGARAMSAQQQAHNDLHGYAQPHSLVEDALPTQAEVEDQYDFHQMIASLGDYPNLQRRLGLVVDLVVTLGNDLPADTGTVQVVATLPVTGTSTDASPRTHYDLGDERFLARPRAGSDLANGLLRLSDATRFRVLLTDTAGSGIKLQNTATNVRGMHALQAWPRNSPDDAGLPALQTAGISIVRAEQVDELFRRFDHSYALNAFLATAEARLAPTYLGAGAPPAPTDELFAEDLTRGYRIDLFDDKSAAWHSVCRRVASYEFQDGQPAPIAVNGDEDEGFVQICSTESLDEAEDDLRVHESLFTWDGWSLAAPRPGLTVHDDEDTAPSDVPNDPMTQFKMTAAFTPRPGSLPRLRFGWNYRARVRMVDLAGNSVFGPDDAAFADTQPETTAEFQFTRFEPVAPPQLALRALPVEGESVEHAVIRSSIHDDVPTVAAQEVDRHVVPPKTSQLMTERNGIFDASPAMLDDQAAYDLASREAGSMTERMNTTTGALELIPGTVKQEPSPGRVYWLQPNDQFEVAFLPDPYARGVVFMGLPGVSPPDSVTDDVNKIAFTGTWPNLAPFRLRVQGLRQPEPPALPVEPATPSWNDADRVLTVQVLQGETVRVRYSSYFDLADLETMGLWEWIQETNPANLQDLEDRAVSGRNWLCLPYRTLTLVHAVEEPLEIPVVPQPDGLAIQPPKDLGATSVTLDGRVEIDAKSTGKIDLRAAWVDPFDDPSKSSYDALTDVVRQEMQIAEVTAHDANDDLLALSALQHSLGDTKYHRVTYTAIGTTRYREYFPSNLQPDELVRPTPAEVGTAPAESARFELDIPNSARPEAMKPLYSVPIFSWSDNQAGGIITKVRRGGGLRLYMDRPWFSSGAGELVGAIIRRSEHPPLSEEWATLRKYVSEWGMDPLWRATETAPLRRSDFTNAIEPMNDLSLEELDGLAVNVAGFQPEYDTDRDLWFCDIALDAEFNYFPFIRLALARYQPISVPGAHLSRLVLSDFMQLLPHRTVEYDLNRMGPDNLIPIRVRGPAYFHRELKDFGSPLVVARLERRRYDTGDELGWETIATQALAPIQQQRAETIWHGELRLPAQPPSPMRVVVLEAETYQADPLDRERVRSRLENELLPPRGDVPPGTADPAGGFNFRIVFADSIELTP